MSLTTEGYLAPRLPEIITEIEGELQTTLPDLDTSPDSLVGNLLAAFGAGLASLSEATQEIYDARTLDGARGVALDDLVNTFYQIERKPATPQRITVDLAGDPSTVVPEGTLFSDDTGTQFALVGDVTLGAAGEGQGEAAAVTPGDSNIDPASVDQVVTPVAGLDSVQGVALVSLGRDRESDASLRARARAVRIGGGKATVTAIRRALLDIDAVSSVNVRDNDTDVEVDDIPPYSFRAIVSPETSDIGTLSQIVAAIAETKPAGIGPVGDQSGVWVQPDNANNEIVSRWDWGVVFDVAVLVEIEATRDLGGFVDDLRGRIADYVNELGIGGVVRRNRIACFAFADSSVTSAEVTLFSGDDIDAGTPVEGDFDPGATGEARVNPGVDRAIVIEVV